MKLSRKGEYALLTLVELARSYGSDQVVSAERLATRYTIPESFS